MNQFILAQVLGAVTLVLSIISLQQRKKEHLLLLQTVTIVLIVLQFLLMGQATGAATFSIVGVRNVVFYAYKKKLRKPSLAVLIIFLCALLAASVITWQNWWSLLPLLATSAKTYGTWQDNMTRLRITSLAGQSCMIAYNLAATLYTGALTEACNLVSTLVALWRFDLRKKNCS